MVTACEKYYNRTGSTFQLRTRAGRLIMAARHIEHVEHFGSKGRGRVLWRRVVDFGRVVWLAREFD